MLIGLLSVVVAFAILYEVMVMQIKLVVVDQFVISSNFRIYA